MAQPLRRQVVIFASALIAVATVAIFYASRLTYEEHVRQLTAETGTMAATVVVLHLHRRPVKS